MKTKKTNINNLISRSSNTQKILLLIALILSIMVSSCGDNNTNNTDILTDVNVKTYQWKMVTSWPKSYPGLGSASEKLSNYVNKMSDGRLTINVFGEGEVVPGLDVFDAVSQGTIQMGHSASLYWKDKIPAAAIFTAIPFGMTATEFNAWITYGGGQALWDELYKPFGILPMLGGSTGAQFSGWFKKEITSIDDFKGLKMRLPGLGGEIFKRAGGVPLTTVGGKIFSSLQNGMLDAAEWIGPYNDLSFGFHYVAQYYYSTVWHEPGSTFEFLINEKAFETLPVDLQEIVKVATQAVSQSMTDEYNARNSAALSTFINEYNIVVKPLPQDVINRLKMFTEEVINEQIAEDESFANVWASYDTYLKSIRKYNKLTLLEYYKNRD